MWPKENSMSSSCSSQINEALVFLYHKVVWHVIIRMRHFLIHLVSKHVLWVSSCLTQIQTQLVMSSEGRGPFWKLIVMATNHCFPVDLSLFAKFYMSWLIFAFLKLDCKLYSTTLKNKPLVVIVSSVNNHLCWSIIVNELYWNALNKLDITILKL